MVPRIVKLPSTIPEYPHASTVTSFFFYTCFLERSETNCEINMRNGKWKTMLLKLKGRWHNNNQDREQSWYLGL